MEVADLMREKILCEALAKRNDMVLNMNMEIQRLNAELSRLRPANPVPSHGPFRPAIVPE